MYANICFCLYFAKSKKIKSQKALRSPDEILMNIQSSLQSPEQNQRGLYIGRPWTRTQKLKPERDSLSAGFTSVFKSFILSVKRHCLKIKPHLRYFLLQIWSLVNSHPCSFMFKYRFFFIICLEVVS